ncbi:MAG: endolytic transglycosylase MltG [Prevotella sp.]|nr:endolytic transglycosylase MltG [Prevotella sp.]
MEAIKKRLYLIAIFAGFLCSAGLVYYYFMDDFSTSDTTEYVYIDDNDDIDSVCVKLSAIGHEHGIIGFRSLARHWKYTDHIRSGRYPIRPGENIITVFRNLKNGHQEPIKLTIPESRTMERLAGALSKKLMLDSLALAIVLHDNDFCAKFGYDTATIACIFVPDTYEIYWNTSVEHLMQRMQREHDHFWNEQRRAKADSIGLTPNEVCTLASIIDEETANNGEKPMIAGMYLNRLKTGMPLQADPTVKFALKDFGLRRIYHDMLRYDSPYNTYRNAGLPPGPIKIASEAGIDAVLNRVAHDYLYMCAKEDFSGTHNFAKTYREHLQNAARYTRALNQRGIK